MAEPAELLLVKDQYEQAFHLLSRGLTAEDHGERAEALECYRKGQQCLTNGIQVPTGGDHQEGAAWDTARQLQHKMMDMLRIVTTHLSNLETSQKTTEGQRSLLSMKLCPSKRPHLAPNRHLYPTIPDITQNKNPAPKITPARPPSPALPTNTFIAPEATPMAHTGDQPPAYTPKPTVGHCSLAHGPSGSGLGSGKKNGSEAAGKELLFIPTGVQMFFVASDGQVSSLSSQGYLRIMTFDNQQSDATAGRPPAFLHVCDWLYPLTADTPVLLANSGIYMFPDSLAETTGSFVGVVLSSELPAADRELFNDLLTQLTELRIQNPEGAGSEVMNLSDKIPLGVLKEQTGQTGPTGEKEKLPLPGWSEKMAQGILTGATKLSEGFVKGAEATSLAIHKGAAKMRNNMTPEETPTEVSPHVTRSLYVAQKASGGAVRVSQFLVNGMSTVLGHVAEKAAPHVKKHGAKLVPESMKKSKDGHASSMDGAKHVAARSFQGFSAVWSSLETGAKLVCKSVSAETVTTVKYKYGGDAGDATDSAIKSVVNVGVAAYKFDNLGIKAIMLTASKETAKAMVKSPDGQPSGAEEKQEHQGDKNGQEAQKKEKEDKKK